jgi:WD40 repeat protein/Cu/Ag efflux protein CusF
VTARLDPRVSRGEYSPPDGASTNERSLAPRVHRLPEPTRLFTLLALVGALACATPAEHEATGFIVSVDPAARTATIRHLDIPGVMGAMTMRFPVQSAGVIAGVAPRDFVRFVLREREGKLVVVRMAVATLPEALPPPPEAVHDHTPHHGGVVGMAGDLHLEALARADGTVRVYLTDFHRQPRALGDVSGSVTLELPAGDRELALRVVDDALEAKGAALADPEVTAHVELKVAGQAVEMDFVLPTTSASTGAAGVPTQGCVPVAAEPGRRTPRCTLDFTRPVTALAATDDGKTLLVAAVDTGVSAWRLPEGSLVLGFEPPPPITVPDAKDLKPHPEGANDIALGPVGREALVALENRLLVYDVTTGRLARELPASAGVVRDVDWSSDGKSLLVVTFYDASVRLVRPETGIEWGRLPVEREASAAAFSKDARMAAVGGESGALVVFTLSGGGPRTLSDGGRAVTALAFAGERLLAGRDGGVVQVWNVDAGRLEREVSTGSAMPRLAVRGDLVASTGTTPTFELLRLDSAEDAEVLRWHQHEVLALAWAGGVLATGDAGGRVGLWEQ